MAPPGFERVPSRGSREGTVGTRRPLWSGEDMTLMVIGLADGKVVLLHGDLHRAK